MARFSCSRARGIFAALTFACLFGIPPAVAETALRIANLAEPETLDPHKAALSVERHVLFNLCECLVVLDPKGNVAPGVAESWSVTDDAWCAGLRKSRS
jgi:ABC-type oligopeptide transport system substrate-binding subunit